MTRYSWNTAKVGIKHQSINQPIKSGNHVITETLLKVMTNTTPNSNKIINWLNFRFDNDCQQFSG